MVWQEEADRRRENRLQPHQEHVQGPHPGEFQFYSGNNTLK